MSLTENVHKLHSLAHGEKRKKIHIEFCLWAHPAFLLYHLFTLKKTFFIANSVSLCDFLVSSWGLRTSFLWLFFLLLRTSSPIPMPELPAEGTCFLVRICRTRNSLWQGPRRHRQMMHVQLVWYLLSLLWWWSLFRNKDFKGTDQLAAGKAPVSLSWAYHQTNGLPGEGVCRAAANTVQVTDFIIQTR